MNLEQTRCATIRAGMWEVWHLRLFQITLQSSHYILNNKMNPLLVRYAQEVYFYYSNSIRFLTREEKSSFAERLLCTYEIGFCQTGNPTVNPWSNFCMLMIYFKCRTRQFVRRFGNVYSLWKVPLAYETNDKHHQRKQIDRLSLLWQGQLPTKSRLNSRENTSICTQSE